MRSTFVILATIVLACARQPHVTDLAGCYQFRWADKRTGTWDAPLPDRIHLSTQPARSDREPVSYAAALRYVWLTNSDTANEPTMFSVHPTWRSLGVDSIEIDLSGGRSPAAFRYVLRARYDTTGLVGAMGARRSREFAPLITFAARSIACAADTLPPTVRGAVLPNESLHPTSACNSSLCAPGELEISRSSSRLDS